MAAMDFDPIAQAYHLLGDAPARLARETPFLRRWAGSAERILDPACGTGVHAHVLAEDGPPGRQVAARDLSPGMIAAAQQLHPHPRVSYAVGDLLCPPAGNWERILLIGNTLNALGDRDSVAAGLAALAAVAAPGASLLLQIQDPAGPEHDRPNQVLRQSADGALTVTKHLIPCPGGRLLSLGIHRWQDDCWEHSHSDVALLAIGRDELDGLLRAAAWRPQAWYGALDGREAERGVTPDLVVESDLVTS